MKHLKGTDPPEFAQAVLRALLDPREKDTIEGDLLEEYRDRMAQGETKGLRAWYIRQTMSFVSAASLRRALFPGCLLWILTAAATEASLLLVAPMLAGISTGWSMFCVLAAPLSITGASMRTAAERRTIFQTAILCGESGAR